jgi:sarcosine oxidase
LPTYDVIVVGLGGMGSAAAYHLASRGQRVLGLERFEPVHNYGSSHGGSRIIRQSYFEDPAYVPLLLRAYELWDRLARDSERDIITLTGGVFLGRPDSLTVAGSLRASRQWDLPHEVLDAAAIRGRFPTLNPQDDEVGLFEAQAGFVRPEATVAAHLLLAERHGADLRYNTPVLRWEVQPGAGVRVWTNDTGYTADCVVVCPGAWAPDILADLDIPFTVERQVMYWFQPESGIAPFLPQRHPIYIHEDAGGVQVYGFPAIDGVDGGAKAAFFRRGQVCTPETIDRQVHPEEVQTMTDHLRAVVPSLPDRFLRAMTCLYTNTPDQHFIIGTHPQHPEVTVACGFSGHGFKFVPVVGEVLADLAVTGSTRHPIGLFDPRRPFAASPQAPPAGRHHPMWG